MSTPNFKDDLIAAIPTLRGFARSLSGSHDRADDLVQETLAKAIANREKYQSGTNLKAWLITILRNQYYSEVRKRRREVEDVDGAQASMLAVKPGQETQLDLQDFLGALQHLPDDQREALILIGASGFSYEEAAEVLETQVGTVKSRVSRARKRLEDVLSEPGAFQRDSADVERSAKQLESALSDSLL